MTRGGFRRRLGRPAILTSGWRQDNRQDGSGTGGSQPRPETDATVTRSFRHDAVKLLCFLCRRCEVTSKMGSRQHQLAHSLFFSREVAVAKQIEAGKSLLFFYRGFTIQITLDELLAQCLVVQFFHCCPPFRSSSSINLRAAEIMVLVLCLVVLQMVEISSIVIPSLRIVSIRRWVAGRRSRAV